jgi:hypothetical protein
VPLCLQFGALSGTAAWDDLDEDARARVRGGVAESLTALRDLSTQTSVNLEHRVSLVEGELCRIDGDLAGALRGFQLALAKSEEDRCLGDVALAHELMARSLRQLSRDEDARGHHAIAVATYEAWGAHARSRALRAGG